MSNRGAVAVLLSLVLLAAGRDWSAGGGAATPAVTLAGTAWHTVHIEGDALFFVPR